jgi:microcin C transport system substrate-binding protein
MRPGITFHDGSPLTAHDVAFSLKTLKEKGHPILQQLLRDLVSAEAPDDTTVLVRLAPERGRDMPPFIAVGVAGLNFVKIQQLSCSSRGSY